LPSERAGRRRSMPGTATMDKASSTIEETSSAAMRVTRLTPHLGSHEQAARLNPADVVRQDNAGVIKRTKPEKQTVFCCLSCTSPCPVEPAALSDESLLP
ncbi:disabled homolog 2-interacting protein isoform X1, partial [Tachysurus ichikawai]